MNQPFEVASGLAVMPTFKSLKSLKPSKVGEKLKATAKSFKSKSKTDAPAVDAVEPPPQASQAFEAEKWIQQSAAAEAAKRVDEEAAAAAAAAAAEMEAAAAAKKSADEKAAAEQAAARRDLMRMHMKHIILIFSS